MGQFSEFSATIGMLTISEAEEGLALLMKHQGVVEDIENGGDGFADVRIARNYYASQLCRDTPFERREWLGEIATYGEMFPELTSKHLFAISREAGIEM